MAKRSDVPTRSDVTETVERHHNDMQESADEIEKVVEDIETVGETLESLDLAGTAEGSEEVEQSIDTAKEVTVEVYEHEDEQLEQLQSETDEHAQELDERSDTTEADLGRISDASGRLNTQDTSNELIQAKEAAIHDLEFLRDQAQRAQDARAESDHRQEEQRSRVNAGRK